MAASRLFFVLLAYFATSGAQQAGGAASGSANGQESLLSFDACKEDIHKLCNKEGVDLKSDMSILECLQDSGYSETATLTAACETLVWQFKVKLTQDDRFTTAAKQYCSKEMQDIPALGACVSQTAPGYALSCMMEFTQNVTKTSTCHAFLSRTERLAFSDFRLVGPFINKCQKEIEKHGCAVITPDKAHEKVRVPHTQGMALECLIQKVVAQEQKNPSDAGKIEESCRHEVMRLAEMQAEDFNLDRPMFFACRADRERYCRDVPAGGGKIFECLLFNRHDQFMQPECAKVLAERAHLMGRDYRMAHPLTKACQEEMTAYKCEPQANLESAAHFHLNWILLCLENGAHQKEAKPASEACRHEMLTHRQLMMEEFRIAPEIVLTCAKEIDQFCSPRGDIEAEGRTLHCLMAHAQERDEKKQVSAECMQAIGTVVKTADIGSNYKVDKVLYASCRPIIDTLCASDAQSEASTLTCLMKNVDSRNMPKECEKRLLEVQYFFARDWTLDPAMYAACHDEAVARCSAQPNWHETKNPSNQVDPGPAILACLYRNAYDEEHPMSPKCTSEVHRVLRTRAVRVNLIPDVEANCREALSEYCSNNVQPQEEMDCLQSNMHKEDFKRRHPACQSAIAKFTQFEAKDTKLNQALTRACRPVIQAHCTQFLHEEIDHGDVMQCLLENKEADEMTNKCRTYVNHFELLTMRDYHFSYRFQQACDSDIRRHCSASGNDKAEIIRCLSSVAFEHRLLGTPEDLQKECRKQLRVAYLQQEQVDFDDKEHMADADPQLMRKCANDLRRLKCDQAKTFEDTIECLRERFEQLEPDCKAMVFEREKIEAVDNEMDDELQRNCKADIGKYCAGYKENVLECLSNTKIVRLLQRPCQKVVSERMREAAKDIRLRPGLLMACQEETKQYCPDDYAKIKNPKYARQMLEGVVVNCLREKFRRSLNEKIRLGEQCQAEISKVILESEFDVKLDPQLFDACKGVIEKHCTQAVIERTGTYENVLECLKADFYSGQIKDGECNNQIALRTQEAMVDVHLDPILYQSCGIDIQRVCSGVQPGHSRVIACLMDALEAKNPMMTQPCIAKLNDRNKLWKKAHDDYNMGLPGSFNELVAAIDAHPQKVSILGWLGGIVFLLFLIGCCCGRATKKAAYELKVR
ncbi:hypothetical protein PMAYCL1PPCAC_06128 [Pristionchus mayeri]|uniref:Golgi apparatus protein 1 n=1 Tax=Pristionchus mayeri TaxID=1317129 RepID=A0AAN4Z7N5_9BILA|nr:hypothetical protein PMAYCL1PPCAC_06128 [Pristionchus mayeri]